MDFGALNSINSAASLKAKVVLEPDFIAKSLKTLREEFIPLIKVKKDFEDLNPTQRKKLAQIITQTYESMSVGTRTMAKINWSFGKRNQRPRFTANFIDARAIVNLVIQAFNNLALLALESRALDKNNNAQNLVRDFEFGIEELNRTEKYPKLTLPLVLISSFWSFYPGERENPDVGIVEWFNPKTNKSELNTFLGKEFTDPLKKSFAELPSLFNDLPGKHSVDLPALQVVTAAYHNRNVLSNKERDFDLRNHADNLKQILEIYKHTRDARDKIVISEALTQWFASFPFHNDFDEYEDYAAFKQVLIQYKEQFKEAIQETQLRSQESDFSLFDFKFDFPGQALSSLPKSVSYDDLVLQPHLNKDLKMTAYKDLFFSMIVEDQARYVEAEFTELYDKLEQF